MGINVIGIVAILTNAFVSTTTDMQNGECRIILEPKCVYMALAFDVFVNFGLTGVFVAALLPALRFQARLKKAAQVKFPPALEHGSPPLGPALNDQSGSMEKTLVTSRADASSPERLPQPHKQNREQAKRSRLEKLFRKTVIGTCLVLVPTIANLVILSVEHGDEPAWFCLTICTLDGESTHSAYDPIIFRRMTNNHHSNSTSPRGLLAHRRPSRRRERVYPSVSRCSGNRRSQGLELCHRHCTDTAAEDDG